MSALEPVTVSRRYAAGVATGRRGLHLTVSGRCDQDAQSAISLTRGTLTLESLPMRQREAPCGRAARSAQQKNKAVRRKV